MRTTSRVRAVGVAVASGALLLTPGIALADHNEFPDCDTRHYPPAACKPPQGGAGHESPPMQANPRDRVPPGTPVSMNASGCAPGASVVIGLARMSSPAQIVGLTQTTADSTGAYSTSAAIPASLPDGTYVLYGECRAPNSQDTTVNTSSFTVQSAPTAGLRTSTSSSSAGSRTSSSSTAQTSDAPAASAAELPASFVAPAAWSASPAVKKAVTEAVNLRLAAMKAALPASSADVAAAPAAAAPADYTPWYAAAGAGALLLLGAAGWRRRATDTNTEVSA